MAGEGGAGAGDDAALAGDHLLHQLAFDRLRLPDSRRRLAALIERDCGIESGGSLSAGTSEQTVVIGTAQRIDVGAADAR